VANHRRRQSGSDEQAQSFQVDLRVSVQVVSDHAGSRFALLLTLLGQSEPALQFSALLLGRQAQKSVGHPDRNLAAAHSLDDLWDRSTLYAATTFSFGCAGHRPIAIPENE